MPEYEFDYQSFIMMEPTEQDAYLQICHSMLESGLKTIVVNGPDAGRTFEKVEELKEWLTLE